MAVQNTDKFLVSRSGINYKTEAQNLMAIQDTDLLLVQRGGTHYKTTGSDLKSYVSPDLLQFFNSYTPPFTSTAYPQYGNMQASENCICALMSNGLWRSTDGINWTKVSNATSRNNYTYPSAGDGAYEGGPQGIAYGGNGIWIVYDTPNLGSLRSTDDGLTWSSISIPSISGYFSGIAGGPGTSGTYNFFVAGNTTSRVSTNGGLSWTSVSTFPSSCFNIASATINGNLYYGAAKDTTDAFGHKATHFYISTDLGQTWTQFGGSVGAFTGIGGGNGAICFAVLNGLGGDSIAYAEYYYGPTYYNDNGNIGIPLVGSYSRAGGLQAGATMFVSGGGKIMVNGHQGTTEFVTLGTDPATYSSVSQSNLPNPASASVYFKGRFFFFDPYSTKIAYTK